MSHKSAKIATIIEECRGRELPAHYLGYFKCFNGQQFYEAHEVLEELWLVVRKGPDDGFYKGLIQLAGAFVHLQKDRLGPATALFGLSRSYLARYPAIHHRLSTRDTLLMIEEWLSRIGSGGGQNPLRANKPPVLRLNTAESV